MSWDDWADEISEARDVARYHEERVVKILAGAERLPDNENRRAWISDAFGHAITARAAWWACVWPLLRALLDER